MAGSQGKQSVVDYLKAREIEVELWRRGDLRYLLRPDGQTRLWNFILDHIALHPDEIDPIVAICHRRLGKSYAMVALGIGRCLQEPGHDCRYGAPELKQCSEIVKPHLRDILSHCPRELKPHKVKDTWFFNNPAWGDNEAISTFTLFSCKENAEDQRGKKTNTLILDEVRLIKNLPYIVNDVFAWQFAGADVKKPTMVMISTPPNSDSHPLRRKYVEPANEDGRYICIPSGQNSDWTERDDRMVAKIVGGKETTSWMREADCEFISDVESMILPEWQEAEKEIVVEDWPRPTHFYPHIFIDTAWKDYTAILFSYVDYHAQLLIVVDELFFRRTTTGDFASELQQKEGDVFGNSYHPTKRIGDFTLQQLEDLRRMFGISVRPADKWDRLSAISYLRTTIKNRRIRVLSRCRKLIRQCRHGILDDRFNFVRVEESEDEDMGHCDGVAALVYGHRLVSWRSDPFPTYSSSSFDTWRAPEDPEKKAEDKRSRQVIITRNPIKTTHRPTRGGYWNQGSGRG